MLSACGQAEEKKTGADETTGSVQEDGNGVEGESSQDSTEAEEEDSQGATEAEGETSLTTSSNTISAGVISNSFSIIFSLNKQTFRAHITITINS